MVDWITPGDFVPPPPQPEGEGVLTLGLPRGFVAAGNGLPCDGSTSAFVRGILIDTVVYNSMSQEQRLALQDPNVRPRWRLYGGPLSTRDLADQWDQFLYFWAFNNNKTWVSHNPVCIAPAWAVTWPPDQSMKWEWVWDNGDRVATRYYDPNQGKNVVVVA